MSCGSGAGASSSNSGVSMNISNGITLKQPFLNKIYFLEVTLKILLLTPSSKVANPVVSNFLYFAMFKVKVSPVYQILSQISNL